MTDKEIAELFTRVAELDSQILVGLMDKSVFGLEIPGVCVHFRTPRGFDPLFAQGLAKIISGNGVSIEINGSAISIAAYLPIEKTTRDGITTVTRAQAWRMECDDYADDWRKTEFQEALNRYKSFIFSASFAHIGDFSVPLRYDGRPLTNPPLPAIFTIRDIPDDIESIRQGNRKK